MTKLVYGVGVNDRKYPAWLNGKPTMEYSLWKSLLKRCYDSKYHQRFPTYMGCKTSENFEIYSYFYEWCQKQIGFDQKDFQLDKDLIIKGNKLYSEDTCLFVPSELNNLLVSRKNCRGSLPVGVSTNQGKFVARCCSTPSNRHIGRFNTLEEAFQAYKEVKEAFIRFQAEKWRDYIDPRTYAALRAYEVSIAD